MPSLDLEAPAGGPSVFLNVPFDLEYSSLFIALIAGTAGLGCTPPCVLEIPSGGRNRLDRLFGLITSCDTSIHDLSRVTLSGDLEVPRFNMPFELGITYALSRIGGHSFFVFEEKSFQLQASLSDLNGHDPHIHNGTPAGVLRCVLDCFGTAFGAPPLSSLEALAKRLTRTALKLQRQYGVEGPYLPHLFKQLAWAATESARRQGLIQ
jgi:hypothetical protein